MNILTEKQHNDFARKIFKYLVKNLEPIGYKKIAKIVKYPVQHTNDAKFRDFLDSISETLNVLGIKMSEISGNINDDVPFIQSLVINVGKKSCGNGFYKFVGYPHPMLKDNLPKKQDLTRIENYKCVKYPNWSLVDKSY